MTVEFKLPGIGEGIESGDVLEVLVSVGDTIEKETEICELETDKATVFVPSDVAGTIKEIHIAAGDTVPVGAVLLTVEAAAGSAAPAPAAAAPPAAAPTPPPAPAAAAPPAPVAATPPPAPALLRQRRPPRNPLRRDQKQPFLPGPPFAGSHVKSELI